MKFDAILPFIIIILMFDVKQWKMKINKVGKSKLD